MPQFLWHQKELWTQNICITIAWITLSLERQTTILQQSPDIKYGGHASFKTVISPDYLRHIHETETKLKEDLYICKDSFIFIFVIKYSLNEHNYLLLLK